MQRAASWREEIPARPPLASRRRFSPIDFRLPQSASGQSIRTNNAPPLKGPATGLIWRRTRPLFGSPLPQHKTRLQHKLDLREAPRLGRPSSLGCEMCLSFNFARNRALARHFTDSRSARPQLAVQFHLWSRALPVHFLPLNLPDRHPLGPRLPAQTAAALWCEETTRWRRRSAPGP